MFSLLLPSEGHGVGCSSQRRRERGHFQIILGEPSAKYFAEIFYQGDQDGCLYIWVDVS